MDIIKRNFLNLLRNGAFGEQLPIEAMSDFKWKVLLSVAKIHLVDNWVGDSLDKGLTVSGQSIPDAGASHLSNAWLNRKLMSIRENEPLSEDASIETLNMLDIIRTGHTVHNNVRIFVGLHHKNRAIHTAGRSQD